MVPAPGVSFEVHREYLGRDGLWSPKGNDPGLKGGLQINVFADRKGYLELAEFIRKFAEKDTSDDADYHEHFEGLMSISGAARLHIILRKDDTKSRT